MRLSTLFGRTLREAPADAEHAAYQLALRAGLVRPTQAGSFALLPLGMLALRKVEQIIHEEMRRIDAQEFRTPVVQPTAAWEQSGRLAAYGPGVLRATDRSGRQLLVAPTHEEAVAELARREVTSHRQLPALVYQVHTKYRDEARARGGLMRMREFTMLDAYSLDLDDAGLDESFRKVAGAFERILARCGVSFVAVEADPGEMGGGENRELTAIAEFGEDTLALCGACGYAANAEVAAAARPSGASGEAPQMSEVATPHTATIAGLAALLGIPASATAKAVFFSTPEGRLVFAVVRGDLEVNEARLRAAVGARSLTPATAEQIAAAGAVPGYASPVGLREGAAIVVADRSVAGGEALVAGANREGFHLRDVVCGRDWQADTVADIAAVREGDSCPRCGAPLRLAQGVELGHVFKLGPRFGSALGATVLDAAGVARPIVMGSYGIGLERLIQAVIDQHRDQAGIVWPAAVAPLDVHLLRLGRGEGGRAAAEELYAELREAGVGVLYDDREESAGVKFADADLVGLPVRALVSDRLLADGLVELRPRGGEARQVPRGEVLAALR